MEVGFKENKEISKEKKSFEKLDIKNDSRSLSDILDLKPKISSIENRVDVREVKEKNPPIENKEQGLRREQEVNSELKEQYPEKGGYVIVPETYLRDNDGKTVKDPETGEKRRIDFVVLKGAKAVDSIEVTSLTANKREQCAKEDRIRENGGNYIKYDGKLYEIPDNLKTRIERRE